MKTHTISHYDPNFVPAYLANGVIGLRVRRFVLLEGSAILNGFVGEHDQLCVEAYNHVPYPLAGDIRLGDWSLSQRPEWAEFVDQSYDFSCGELRTRFAWHVGEVKVQVEVLTFCSRSLPTLACQEWSVSVDKPCKLALQAGIDPTGLAGEVAHRGACQDADGSLLWRSPGALSSCGQAYVCEFVGEAKVERQCEKHGLRNPLATRFAFEAQPGKTYTLRQFSSTILDRLHSQPEQQAIRMAYLGGRRGWEKLREENHAAWAELWKGRPKLIGASTRWQDIADASFFYLHSSIHAASPSSTALFGLGQWSGYHSFWGHVFWDIETFSFPPTLLTAPDAARAMLDYRSRNLDAAHANAAMNGYRGLQFPWQSAPTRGDEMLPDGSSQMLYEQHINLDVAFAFAQYVHASNDDAFAREQAWPVLQGVAQWLCSRVRHTARGFEIDQVMGICEGRITDNNSFVNMAAMVVLREASQLARRLGFAPPAQWETIAAGIFLPTDDASHIILDHDQSLLGRKHNCTETLAGFYPYTYHADETTRVATTNHYLELGKASLGWPMLPQLLGVHAARLGDRQRAAFFLEKGCADYVFEPFLQTDEFGKEMTHTKQKVGPYLAHAGGFLMNLLIGLPGLQLGPGEAQSWAKFPVVMPEGWDGIEVERIWAHGQPAHLRAMHGQERATIEVETS